MQNYTIWVKDNHWPQIYSVLILPFQSLLPTGVWKWVTQTQMGAPFGATNLSGPFHQVTLCGNKVLEKYAYVGLLWRHSSIRH
jgi:hypothetical protein